MVRPCSFLSVLEACVLWRSWQVMPASTGKACSYLPSLEPFPSLPPPLRLLPVVQTNAFPGSDSFAQAVDGHACLVAQSCPTFCNRMDYSLPVSSVHGTFQGRRLEWIAISFSRESSWPRNWTHLRCRQILYLLSHWGGPLWWTGHTSVCRRFAGRYLLLPIFITLLCLSKYFKIHT